MLLLAAAAAISAASPIEPRTAPITGAAVQATVTVRVISGVRLSFGPDQDAGAPKIHEAWIKTGPAQQPAKLIEFE